MRSDERKTTSSVACGDTFPSRGRLDEETPEWVGPSAELLIRPVRRRKDNGGGKAPGRPTRETETRDGRPVPYEGGEHHGEE